MKCSISGLDIARFQLLDEFAADRVPSSSNTSRSISAVMVSRTLSHGSTASSVIGRIIMWRLPSPT